MLLLTWGRKVLGDLRLCLGSQCWSWCAAAALPGRAPALVGRWWIMLDDNALRSQNPSPMHAHATPNSTSTGLAA